MPINVELLEKVRDKIRENPQAHHQANWGFKSECGTTHCIAGWAAALDGAVMDWEEDGFGHWYADYVNGGADHIESYAKEALGLSSEQAYIFYSSRDEALQMLDVLITEGRRGA